jgi:hypothetical protein
MEPATSRPPSRRRLTLDEVRQARVPAVFRDFGDNLVYIGGTVYSLPAESDPHDLETNLALPDTYVITNGVGIEFGWEHLHDCDCPLCRRDVA